MGAREGQGGETVLLTPRSIGDLNRARIIRALCDHGPASRADLARIAGVPRATIGAIVQGLMEDGLVEETAQVHTPGQVGKPARPLWFRRDAGRSLAVAFSPEGVRAATVNARAEILSKGFTPLDPRGAGPDELAAAVVEAIRGAMPGKISGLLGVGLAVPGLIAPDEGRVVGSGQLPGAVGDGLVKAVRRATRLPVVIDNDARALALAEYWFGQGRGLQTVAAVQTGAGLGVGLVVQGTLYRGQHGITGELGHTCVIPDGPDCRCGLRGCWETVATLDALRAVAAARGVAGARTLTAESLRLRAEKGDVEAAELLDRYAEDLSRGLAILVNLLGPQRVILHGDVTGGGQALLERVVDRTAGRVFSHLRDRLDLVLSELGEDAELLGAAGLVLSETFRLGA